MNTLVVKHDREGFLDAAKWQQFGRAFTGGARGADAYLDRFTDFVPEKLRERTGKRLQSVLLDVDACIALHYGQILPQNIVHIRSLLENGLQIGVCSNNGKSVDRLNPLREMGVQVYEGKDPKPRARAFLVACDQFGFDSAATWMVDDNPNTGGGAIGILEGMAFIKPLGVDWGAVPSIKKALSLPLANAGRRVALMATTIGNSRILHSSNL